MKMQALEFYVTSVSTFTDDDQCEQRVDVVELLELITFSESYTILLPAGSVNPRDRVQLIAEVVAHNDDDRDDL